MEIYRIGYSFNPHTEYHRFFVMAASRQKAAAFAASITAPAEGETLTLTITGTGAGSWGEVDTGFSEGYIVREEGSPIRWV